MHQDQPDTLDAYLAMSAEDVATLVLCLLIEEMLKDRLSAYRDFCQPFKTGSGCAPIPLASEDARAMGSTSLTSTPNLNF
jgi:hypothetical protein